MHEARSKNGNRRYRVELLRRAVQIVLNAVPKTGKKNKGTVLPTSCEFKFRFKTRNTVTETFEPIKLAFDHVSSSRRVPWFERFEGQIFVEGHRRSESPSTRNGEGGTIVVVLEKIINDRRWPSAK